MFQTYIKPVLVLTLIAAVSAVMLTVTHRFTSQRMAENNAPERYLERNVRHFQEAMPNADDFVILRKRDAADDRRGVVAVVQAKHAGEEIGYVFAVHTRGYSVVPIQTAVGIDLDGQISGVAIMALRETPGIGDRVQNREFLDRFVTTGNTEPPTFHARADGITGATLSAGAVIRGIEEALQAFWEESRELC